MRVLALAAVGVSLFGCQPERLNPGAVAMGVARLSVRNAAVLTSLLTEDARCGFASPGVRAGAEVAGAAGQAGSVTWRVEGCTLDLGPLRAISRDCRGVETLAGGKVTLSATRTVEGVLTGSAENPVVPSRPDAVVMRLEATLDGLSVARSDSQSSLELRSGRLSWEAQPRLAVGAATGLCTAATSELGVSELRFEDAEVVVTSGERRFAVAVPSSRLDAQLGRWGERENWLSGELRVWDVAVAVPVAGDARGLNTDYDAAAFVESYACRPELAQPLSRACGSLSDRLAQGAAQLTVATFGTVALAADEDAACGFSAPAVLAAGQGSGPVGTVGTVTFRLPAPCALTWPARTAVRTSCDGAERRLEGRARVLSGTKTVAGWITGDPAQPVIPTSRDAARVELELDLAGLTYSESASDKALAVGRGTLSGEVRSRLALDTSTGACSIKSPVAAFRELRWLDAQLSVMSGGAAYPLAVGRSRLEAQSGAREDRSNHLAGELEVGGVVRQIPVAGEPVLDPQYDQARFDASWACLPGLRVPASDAECSFHQVLAAGAARLVVQSAGAVAALVNGDKGCGFESALNKLNPTQVQGTPPQTGLMAWTVRGCGLGGAAPQVLDEGCTGGRRLVSGRANVTARREVVGERETVLLVVPSIIPRTRDAVRLELTEARLTDFAAWSLAPGAAAPSGKLLLHEGRLATTLRPILGERRSDPGRFDVATPVGVFSAISLDGARATLSSGAKTFVIALDQVRLVAQAGAFKGTANTVSGTLWLNGLPLSVGPLPLDPSFDQAAFDQSYACTPDLLGPVPAN